MDRASDRRLEPGQRVVVAAARRDDALHSAPMRVEQSSGGPESTVHLRLTGAWHAADERRLQVRVPMQITPTRARHWVGGAWRDIDAKLVDLSSRGVGLSLTSEVQLGARLSLVVPLADGHPDLRLTVEVRHVRRTGKPEQPWRAGGLFRTLSQPDHERLIRFIFAELRSR
jgi:hypothetical protein